MAAAKTKAEQDSAIVTEEMKAAAKADLEERTNAQASPAKRRTRQRPDAREQQFWIDETLAIPVELNLDYLSPTSYLTTPVGEITGFTDTQEFEVVEERLKGLTFAAPGRNLPAGKRQYTVKAFHQDGRLVQLPFEQQIQNTAGGEIEDAIGLRRYERKGILLLFDFRTMMPVYCAARECWAAAMREELLERFPEHRAAVGTGFCSVRHAQFTLPNRFRDAGAILSGMFGQDATTSRIWDV